ncbi:peptide-methionine (S)-S-oxide reductase MsrA [Spongiibacter taiwanensis]|uniref:peptide-methionine (S)-S-oxide reductase MsrA n=1 Tax=Spongiibacter taiwanensis TaxID=1748242 RepID=UPI00203631C9|nr:peptide-methionine (S)-S-oxide reductase MsrA [Spongiibacter taiwanensis]USA43902.1 peptide-methionine (S)-S-oxide reductase MsrA [Spongiibacter taiwanensis]
MSVLDRYRKSALMPSPEEALPGREVPITKPGQHTVLGTSMAPPFPEGMEQVLFGMGCFWGAERKFWQVDGVYTTAVGYSGGYTPNPKYEEVCSGATGHNEVVLVVFDPAKVSFATLLKVFWESHNPTEGMSQGYDVGTQYRSGIYCFGDDQLAEAQASREVFQRVLAEKKSRLPAITTEIVAAGPFYYAEPYHQQYLDKNPQGYCGLGGLGLNCGLDG